MDISSLCAAVAQSAAALVAIVAGFVLSHLLSLSGERSQLQARLGDVEAELSPKRDHLREVEERLLSHDAADLIYDCRGPLIGSEGEYPLQAAMEEHGGGPWSEEELQPYWEGARRTVKSAVALLRERPELGKRLEDLERDLRCCGVELNSWEVHLYQGAWLHVRHPEWADNSRSGVSSIPIIRPEADAEYVTFAQERRDRMVADVDAARQVVTELEAQVRDLEERLDAFPQPAGFGRALALLGYIAAGGIVLPLGVMAVPQAGGWRSVRWVVLGLFTSGLVFFFSYLAAVARSLADNGGVPRSSRSPLRLRARARGFLASLEERPPVA